MNPLARLAVPGSPASPGHLALGRLPLPLPLALSCLRACLPGWLICLASTACRLGSLLRLRPCGSRPPRLARLGQLLAYLLARPAACGLLVSVCTTSASCADRRVSTPLQRWRRSARPANPRPARLAPRLALLGLPRASCLAARSLVLLRSPRLARFARLPCPGSSCLVRLVCPCPACLFRLLACSPRLPTYLPRLPDCPSRLCLPCLPRMPVCLIASPTLVGCFVWSSCLVISLACLVGGQPAGLLCSRFSSVVLGCLSRVLWLVVCLGGCSGALVPLGSCCLCGPLCGGCGTCCCWGFLRGFSSGGFWILAFSCLCWVRHAVSWGGRGSGGGCPSLGKWQPLFGWFPGWVVGVGVWWVC